MTRQVISAAAALRRVNRALAVLIGLGLLATGLMILAEIVLRQTPLGGFGGSDEISGYVMAAFATWGFSYALLERAHVRIDLLQRRLPGVGRAFLDLLALSSLAATAGVVAWSSYDVLAKTLARGSRANTPLETPLWIPQSIWFAGWVWFALTASLLLICLVALLLARRLEAAEALAGTRSELETAE